MTSTNKRDGGEVERLATWLKANSSGVYRDCRTAADLLREQERAESRAECERWKDAHLSAWAEAGAQSEARAFAEARAERLAGAGKRVTAAFRALGCKLGFTELVETRHECEAAILALDAALEQEPQE